MESVVVLGVVVVTILCFPNVQSNVVHLGANFCQKAKKDKQKKKAQFFYPHVGAKESGSNTVTKKGIRNGQKYSQKARIA